jgi:LuxR family maltose regulon positive regulatory protein
MAALLRRMKEGSRTKKGSRMSEYLDRLLAAFKREESREATLHSSAVILQPLVEPLSARELEVMRLLASGATNAEIAHELVITLNTTKKHITHIFEKLGATNRADAVARARELGIGV